MSRSPVIALALAGGLTIAAVPALTYTTASDAWAAQTTSKQKKKTTTTNYNQPTKKKKSYCGYPAPPNPAGMTDYCAFQYNVYCRRGVGCSKYGRDFMSFDD